MNKFEVGDQVYILWNKTGYPDYPFDLGCKSCGVVVSIFSDGDYITVSGFKEDDPNYSLEFYRYQLIHYKNTKKSIMQKISNYAKSILDADTKSLIKAGFLTTDLELTYEGKAELESIILQANKAGLVASANEKMAEEAKK